MRFKQQNFLTEISPKISSVMLVLMLLTSTLINVQAQNSSSWQSEEPLNWNNNIDFLPNANQSYINTTESTMIQIPANHTFKSGQLEISPIWQPSNTSHVIDDSSNGDQWFGDHNDTIISTTNNELRLKRNSSFSQ